MKKVLALVLAAVLLCGGLIACTKSGSAGDNRIVGTWNLTKGVSSGITIDASKLNMEMAFVFDSITRSVLCLGRKQNCLGPLPPHYEITHTSIFYLPRCVFGS